MGYRDRFNKKKKKNLLIGKWKLQKAETFFYKTEIYNYSEANIFYEFTPRGTLFISGEDNEHLGNKEGSYKYSIINSEKEGENDILTIDSNFYSIARHELQIDNLAYDGVILYLSRIED